MNSLINMLQIRLNQLKPTLKLSRENRLDTVSIDTEARVDENEGLLETIKKNGIYVYQLVEDYGDYDVYGKVFLTEESAMKNRSYGQRIVKIRADF